MVLKVYDNLLMLLLIGYIAGQFGWTVAPESQDNYVIKFTKGLVVFKHLWLAKSIFPSPLALYFIKENIHPYPWTCDMETCAPLRVVSMRRCFWLRWCHHKPLPRVNILQNFNKKTAWYLPEMAEWIIFEVGNTRINKKMGKHLNEIDLQTDALKIAIH